MKDHLRQLFNKCMEQGSEEDLLALVHVLEGMGKKIDQTYVQYIDGLLHMDRVIDKENKTCVITIPINSLLNNSLDIVHGGITATLLDTAMGSLAISVLPEGYAAVTSQLNIHYLAPGIGETLRCEAKIIHHGSKTFVVAGDVYRSDGKKVAYATGTFFTIQK